MTTLIRTDPSTDSRTDLDAAALDGLAAAAEQAADDLRTRAVLALVVRRLEQATGAVLGDTSDDPLVVLQRRFGRAHTRLAEHRPAQVDAALLLDLARALQPEPVAERGPWLRPAPPAVLAAC